MTQHDEPTTPAGDTAAAGVRRESPSIERKALAWSVHLLTASGAVFCLLAIDAGIEHRWRAAFAWLALAVWVDAVDGALARAVRVKEVLPRFDGENLDNIVDYVSYVIVPAFFIHRAALLPDQCSLWGAACIALASAYQFCQEDAKTPDHFFKGFPSYWNVVAFYMLALDLSAVVNLAIIALLIVLVFVPIKYVYPSRTPQFRMLTLGLATLWGVALIVILWQLPDPSPWLVRVSLLFVVYYVAVSLFLAVKRRTHGG